MSSAYYCKRAEWPAVKATIVCLLLASLALTQFYFRTDDTQPDSLRRSRRLATSANTSTIGSNKSTVLSTSVVSGAFFTTVSPLPTVTTASSAWTTSTIADSNVNYTWSENDSCSDIVLQQTAEEKCAFAQNVTDCNSDGLFQYTEYLYCEFAQLKPLLIIIYLIWLLYLLLGMGISADGFVCPSLATLAKSLRMSPNVAGVTLVAFGNGAPDIFSSIAAINNSGSDRNLAIGLIFGAGVFVTTIVASIISIVAPFRAMERPLIRDILFYMLTAVLIIIFLFDKKVAIYEAFLLIAVYIIYVTTVMIAQRIFRKQRARKLMKQEREKQVIERRLSTIDGNIPSLRPTAHREPEEVEQNDIETIAEVDETKTTFESDTELQDSTPEHHDSTTELHQLPRQRVTIIGSPSLIKAASTATLLNGHSNPTFHEEELRISPSMGNLEAAANAASPSADAVYKRITWGGFLTQKPSLLRRRRPEDRLVLHALTSKNSPAYIGWIPKQPKITRTLKDALRFAENVIIGTALYADLDTIAVTPADIEDDFLAPLPEMHAQCCDIVIGSGNRNDEPAEANAEEAGDDAGEHEEQAKFFASSSTWRILLQGLNPINVANWSKASWFSRCFTLIKAPVVLALLLALPVVDQDEYMRKWNRPLRALQCFVSPAVATIAFQQYGYTVFIGAGLPLAVLAGIIGLPFGILVFFTSQNNKEPSYHIAFACVAFLCGMAMINACASEMVNLLQTFGIYIGISQAIIGLTLLSWGGSIGDLVADVALARQGFSRMGISACFGGPLFNALIGLGVPFSIACVKASDQKIDISMTPVVLVLQCFLLVSLLSTLIIVPIRRFKFDWKYGIYLIALYISFFITVVTVEIKAGHKAL